MATEASFKVLPEGEAPQKIRIELVRATDEIWLHWLLHSFIIIIERNSELDMQEQTDLVDLSTLYYTTRKI